MNKNDDNKIQLFEDKKVRIQWDDKQEKWWLSVVDVVAILIDSDYQTARKYWKNLKNRLLKEGSVIQLVTNCYQLRMQSSDGKYYNTDVGDTEQMLRLIQSIPSKKAEPFKLWLARVGNERLDEIADPELAIDRAFETYLKKGYSENWINQRIKSMEVRKGLTDEFKRAGIKTNQQYATLTDIITHEWSGINTREYKILKGLKKENLRDHMTNTELILNMLAEAATTDFSKVKNPIGMDETIKVAKQGGSVAKAARKEYELQSGKDVVSPLNALDLKSKEENENLQLALDDD
ncbi:MAG: Bro-N domain-containing protein [Oscillospiraceae bacterium]|nr:Bro-N domain-containing protein [Oscillospiraceae bacterium]